MLAKGNRSGDLIPQISDLRRLTFVRGGLAFEAAILAMMIEQLIERDREKIKVFAGTCVPIKSLFEFLEDNQTMETCLDQFPTVSRTQALAVLSASRDLLLSSSH